MKIVLALLLTLGLVGTAIPITYQSHHRTDPVANPERSGVAVVKKPVPDLSTPEKRHKAVEQAKKGELALTLEELRIELARLRRALGQEQN